MEDNNIHSNAEFAATEGNPAYPPQRIKVIGVGGGGGNAINHMYNLGVRNVSFVVANTDRQALQNSPVPTKVLLGPNISKGLGAGNDPEVARAAAEESKEEISALFDNETDMAFITAGMGGGTGTGASPVIARLARDRGILTIGIVTIPFLFEGRMKIRKALEGANEMGKNVDALLVINNDRLSEIYKDWDFINAFGKADDILAMAAISISEIVTCSGHINLDFKDVDRTLRDGGTALIATGYGEGEGRVTKAIEDALNSPLLRNTNIYGSKKLLFNLYFSREAEDTFKIDETNQITDFISNLSPEVDVIWGVCFDESLGNRVKFTILAAGFDVNLEEAQRTNQNTEKNWPPKPKKKETVTDEAINNAYGSERVDSLAKSRDENRFIVLKPGQFDNDESIAALTERPAFNRDKSIINNVRSGASQAPASSTGAPARPQNIEFDDI